MHTRHGIFTNIIAVVLVLTMPLCCCIVKSATGGSDSCCSTSVQEEVSSSCCQEEKTCCEKMEQSEEKSDSQPCDGDCGCTIKGTIYVQEWTPPIDLFGTDTPTPIFFEFSILSTEQDAITFALFAHGPPKYDPHVLGFSSAPPIRGTLILEV